MMLLEVINQDEEGYGNVILTNLWFNFIFFF